MVNKYPNTQLVNLDALTYAGNLDNVADVANASNYTFVQGDIIDASFVNTLFDQHRFDGVVHLAAESHVDNSIKNPLGFAQTKCDGNLEFIRSSKKPMER